MLERGEAHVGIRLYRADPRFESRLLPPAAALAVAAPRFDLGRTGVIDVRDLASYPLLLLDPGYSVRILFDAACRLADVRPNVLLESRAPHTLLALAEIGHGVAIIPSLQRTDRYAVRIARVTLGRKPVQERVSIQWDRRRRLPPYAVGFCEALAEYMQPILPITHPTKPKEAAGRGKSVLRISQRMKPARTIGAGLDVQGRQVWHGPNSSKV
jgi:DNA-binding transcriptional LysR family regulator